MATDLSTTFTGVRFRNPFLLSSARRPSRVEYPARLRGRLGRRRDQDHRAPSGRQRARPEDEVPARGRRFGAPVDEEAAGRGAALVVELSSSPTRRSTGGCRASADQAGLSRSRAGGVGDGRIRERHRAAPLAGARGGVPGAGLRCAGAEPVVPAHGSPRHGIERRQGQGLVSIVTKVVKDVATVPVWAKLTPSTTDIVVEARARCSAAPTRSCRRTPSRRCRSSTRRRSSSRSTSTASCRPAGLRPGDSAAVAREDVAADAGVSGPQLFRHRRDLDLRARPELLPARVRHGPGVHGGDARHAIGPNVIRELNAGLARFLEAHADKGWTTIADAVGVRRDRVVAQSKIRRPGEKDYGRLRGGRVCGRSRNQEVMPTY